MSEPDDDVRAGRAALLDLLADLFLRELEERDLAAITADPVLGRALQPPAGDEARRQLRAEFASLLLIEVPPYASIYLDVPPVIGGDTSLRWERLLASLGQPVRSLERAASPDHAGLYLRACAEAERRRDAAPILREALAWLPQCLTAIERNAPASFYGNVAALAGQALWESARATPYSGEPLPAEEPPAPEDSGLRELSRWLTTPAFSGWFLSKRALRRMAQPFGVGVGMVDRAQALEQVFEASGLDGRTSALLATFQEELAGWAAALAAWREQLGLWAELLAPWAARLNRTRALLDEMRAAEG